MHAMSVFTTEPDTDLPEMEQRDITHPYREGDITEAIVTKLLKALKVSKAGGLDGAHPRVLRELSETLAKPLSIIFKTSLRTGRLPRVWKQAAVSSIYKKGSKKQPGNYRPVSLTSVVCKVMETIVRDWIQDHLLRNNLLSTRQFGFIGGRSTTLQLLRAMEDWTDAIDSGQQVDVVYFDFAKAFDSVPHKRLLAKLEAYGITGATLAWIKDFLTGREQKVSINGKSSRWHAVTSGIPQGSVLGPLCFVVYINDVPEVILSLILLFADDTKIYRVIREAYDRHILQQDVHIRPHVEYAMAVWKPYKRMNIDLLEKVQHRATKWVPGLRNLSYSDRLLRLKLPTLAYRRLRGDMIEVYKITSGTYDTRASHGILHRALNSRTRGHSRKLEMRQCRLDVRKHSFSHRVVNLWNSLPEQVVTAPTLHTFENRLDRHWRHHPLQWDEHEPETALM